MRAGIVRHTAFNYVDHEDEALQSRLRMALAEAGYPNAHVFWNEGMSAVHVTHFDASRPDRSIPWDVIDRAFAVCSTPHLTSTCIGR